MSYDASTKIITAPVSIADLIDCFGVAMSSSGGTKMSFDLGFITKSNTGSTVTDADNVTWTVISRVAYNKWSKHKPIRHASVKQLTTEQWTDNSRGNGARYGLYCPNGGQLPFDASGNYIEAPWFYDKPELSDNPAYPARMTDFEKYYHNAPCPIRMAFPSDLTLTISSSQSERENTTIAFTMEFENAISGYRSDDTCMSLEDILGANRNWYMAVGFWRMDGSTLRQFFAYSADMLSVAMSGSVPILQVFVNMQDFYSAVGSSAIHNGDQWNCRVFLSSSNTSPTSLQATKLIEYATDADYRVFTVSTTTPVDRLGTVTLTTTLVKSGTEYYCSQAVVKINKGTYSSGSVNIALYGICPTGTMVKSSTTYTQLELYSGTMTLSGQETTQTIPLSASNGKWNFDNTNPSYPHIAVVRCDVSIGGNTKSVATTTDVTSGESSYTSEYSG